MWPRTELIERLQIEHPLLQAPMGDESAPEIAIAVGRWRLDLTRACFQRC